MTLVLFEGRLGWYWRLVAKNNRVIAVGAEPFSSKRAAHQSFGRLQSLFSFVASAQISTRIQPRKPRRRNA